MSKIAIDIIGTDNCTSCFGCKNICPNQSIDMLYDKDGFLKPIVNYSTCIECGKCAKICPIINSYNKEYKFKTPITYGGWSKNNNIQAKSSSGGYFYEIAKYIINQKGVVCGVKWHNCKPVFDIAKTEEEIKPFMSSKYLQADVGFLYKKVKELIDKKILVLFVGLPCQVAAVKNIVDSELLITIDLACAGVPSYKVFQKHLAENYNGKNITHINFRAKTTGWRNFSLLYYSDKKLISSVKHTNDMFFQAFNGTYIYNKSCYSCKLNTIPRIGNFTLADYWGAKDKMNNPKGVSLFLINDEKGEKIIDSFEFKDKLFLVESSFNEVVKGTVRLNLESRKIPKERELIFRELDSKSLKQLRNKYFKPVPFIKRVLKALYKRIF